MKILAIDTSSEACSVALQNGTGVKIRHNIAPMQHAQIILPMIQTLLAMSSLTIQNLDAIAYGCGPGSFTGVRIASSVAQGIGFAAQIPIIPISSLAAIAQSALLEREYKHLLVVLNARRHQVYYGLYQPGSDGCVYPIDEEQLCHPETIGLHPYIKRVEPHASTNWCGMGEGWRDYEEILIKALRFRPQSINSLQLPTAQAILALSRKKLKQGEWVKPEEALPRYLR